MRVVSFWLSLVLLTLGGPVWSDPIVSGVVRVVDGDGFYVGAVEVRLFGIDAPELGQTCTTEQGVTWRCGRWVRERVAQRFEGRVANCSLVTTDRYGRAVARCRVGGQDVSETLVLEGLAFAYRTYSDDYVLAEKRAAVRDAGLHAHRVQQPSWYRATRAKGRIPLDPDCWIKGNISASGEHIFHVPGQRFYERTGIRHDKGEQWFCSGEEARAAGWRAARH
ncbi:thermonuclease family protein [uncultured Roseobacter sp.]|uniref:thermonuclease family protein n=1 Tax=uncultured Roseobacter sp. TaxID=114847 RepID=UPI00260878E9|nr:thermonuclease family protein [uncultured Roseobacter sp.]